MLISTKKVLTDRCLSGLTAANANWEQLICSVPKIVFAALRYVCVYNIYLFHTYYVPSLFLGRLKTIEILDAVSIKILSTVQFGLSGECDTFDRRCPLPFVNTVPSPSRTIKLWWKSFVTVCLYGMYSKLCVGSEKRTISSCRRWMRSSTYAEQSRTVRKLFHL